MSKKTVDKTNCEHEYMEIRTHDITGDDVRVCCHCDEVMGISRPESCPEHWFDSTVKLTTNEVRLSQDILNGKWVKNPSGERVIHMCGVCGHHLTAVHGGWFSEFGNGDDIDDSDSSFLDNLREVLCPNCDSACFRQGSVVASLGAAKELPARDIKRYISNRADARIWSNGLGSYDDVVSTLTKLETSLRDHGWNARCPACGYAEAYGDREFDFHHWDYDNDVGCALCRKCHNRIHDDMTAREQSQKTGKAWQYDAIKRLVTISNRHGLPLNSEREFKQRYNIPPDKTLYREAVADAFIENDGERRYGSAPRDIPPDEHEHSNATVLTENSESTT